MQEKNWKKGEVIAAIAVLLFSALFIAGNINALEPKKGDFGFFLYYNENGNLGFLSGVTAYLFTMDENLVTSKISQNGIVDFTDVDYGYYVIKISSEKIGNAVFDSGSAIIHFNSTGAYLLYTGERFTNITVNGHPFTSKLNLTLTENGAPISPDVYLYYNGTEFQTNYSKGHIKVSVPQGVITIKVVLNQSGVEKVYYKDVYVNTPIKNVSMDIGKYHNTLVSAMSNGDIINTELHVILINKSRDEICQIFTTKGGALGFYLFKRGDYRMIVTADGYGIKSIENIGENNIVNLQPVDNKVTYEMTFSNDMKWMNLTYTMDISNETIIYSLPHSNLGVLYYQLKLNGWSNEDLKYYMLNRVRYYTDNVTVVDGEIYELKNVVSRNWQTISSNEGFKLTLKVSYYNGDLNKDAMLKDGKIDLTIYTNEDHPYGANRVYNYILHIPSDLERSNEVTMASVAGYINTVTVNSVKETPITIILKERKSPEIRLDAEHFVIGWKNMSNVNHIVNQSSDNYTVVIPAYKDVWFNASKMAYDVVLNKVDYENTTYTWVIDGNAYQTGKGIYNITKRFSRGLHKMQIKVEDIGENTNETNITLLSDNMFPSVNITIKEPSGKVIATLVTNSTRPARIDYNITGKKSWAWYNWTTKTVKIPQELTFNESQEIVYDASSSYDTYDGNNKTNLPVIVEWNFNGNKSTGDNRTFSFDKPTRNGTYYVNITLKDSVNDTIIISLNVKIKDITKPVVRLNFTVNRTNINEVKEEENVTLDATGSYDPENGTITTYNWTIKNSDFKIVNATDGVYDILNGSFSSDNVTIVFHKYGTYYIILNVTDADGNYNIVNKSLRVTPVRPDLAISDVSIKGDRVEGSQIKFEVNVTNNGNAIAKTYWIAIIANGKIVKNKSYSNLKNQSSQIQVIIWKPDAPGNYSLKIKVWCSDEPASYISDNEKDEHIIISPAPWKTPAIVTGVIVIIAVIGYIGWRAMKRKGEKKGFKKKSKKKEKTKEKEKS